MQKENGVNKTKPTGTVKTQLSLEQRKQDGELKKMEERVLFAIGNKKLLLVIKLLLIIKNKTY